ncbi:hemerythrin domain-containing protein [Streptomyces hydrogenans]
MPYHRPRGPRRRPPRRPAPAGTPPAARAEERFLYPALADALGGGDATATMSRSHAEIHGLATRIETHLHLPDRQGEGFRDHQADDLRACLYGLAAVLRLHVAHQEENLLPGGVTSRSPEWRVTCPHNAPASSPPGATTGRSPRPGKHRGTIASPPP